MKASERFERVMINCTAPGTCFEKTKEAAALMKRFEVRGWPHVLFLDPMGEFVERIRGGCGPETYLKRMDRIATKYDPARRLEELAPGERVMELARAARGDGPAAKRAKEELRRLRDAAAAALALANG